MEEPKKNIKEEMEFKLFKTINNFVSNLNDCYGSKQKSLQLYARLISKTTIGHQEPMRKHISAFEKFCKDNRSAIINKNEKELVTNCISYNEKVFINMKLVFAEAVRKEKPIIWKHLLAIYAHIDPTSKAKELLRESMDNEKNEGGKEEDFINDIFDKVGNNIEPEGNPLQAVGSLMSSGVFTDIVTNMTSGLESGELNLGKLMGTMQGMVSTIGDMAEKENGMQGPPPEMSQMLNQMNTMMSTLNTQMEQTEQNRPGSAPSVPSAPTVPTGPPRTDILQNTAMAGGSVPIEVNIMGMMNSGGSGGSGGVVEDSRFEVIDDGEEVSKTKSGRRKSKKNSKRRETQSGVIGDVDTESRTSKKSPKVPGKASPKVPEAPELD